MPFVTRMNPDFAVLMNEVCDGLTNEQVAVRVGISAEYVRKLRKLGLVPNIEIVQKIADGFAAPRQARNITVTAADTCQKAKSPYRSQRLRRRGILPARSASRLHRRPILTDAMEKGGCHGTNL